MKTVIHWICCWIVVALLAWRCAPAAALVVTPPSTNSSNMTSPDPGIGWDNVANRGVYLGNRWVISCMHLGEQGADTFFPSLGLLAYEPGTAVRLESPLTPIGADLVMYRLMADPGLPLLSIAKHTPAVGAEVTFVSDGNAINPTDSESHWKADWTPDTGSGPYAHSGYTSTTTGIRWGTNRIERDSDFFEDEDTDDNDTVIVDDGNGFTITFFTRFDKQGDPNGNATDHETQGQAGDSGGAVFAMEDGHWVLAGVNLAVLGDQPTVAMLGSTAAYGNLTFVADLSQYRLQIFSVMGIPEPGSFWLVGGVGAMVGLVRLGVRRFR